MTSPTTMLAPDAAVATDAAKRADSATGTILALTHDPKHPLFTSWLSGVTRPVQFISSPRVGYEFSEDVALVVGADCYNEPWVTLLRKAVDAGIPTLILADGILEYRNTWEHPQLTPGALFQPVLGHKIACLGRSQVRVLQSWGNPTQCEAIGAPRFDRYAGLRRRERPADGSFRVLVMTALTPYFTPAHHERVRQSLLDVKAAFARGVTVDGVRVEPVWRVTKGLDKEVGVDSVITDLTGKQLADVLQNIDAVVTTPSTSMLEAMLLGLPVAMLDYTNVPAYVQPAWRISAAEHILPTLTQLVNPAPPKLLFQDATLHDALECATPAAPRMLRLVEKMIDSGEAARRTGQPLAMTWSLSDPEERQRATNEARFDLGTLYPGHAPFSETDLRALQVEVGQLRRYAATLEQQIGALRGTSAQTTQLTIAWRSKLEAALAVARLGQKAAAAQLMIEGVKAVESSPDPAVTLDALVEISTHLAPLDAGRAAYLANIAIKIAERLGNAPQKARAQGVLASLSGKAAVGAKRQ